MDKESADYHGIEHTNNGTRIRLEKFQIMGPKKVNEIFQKMNEIFQKVNDFFSWGALLSK